MSCDSVQVYRDVFIGCNKPSEEEMREVRHHLVDVASLDETFNAGTYYTYCTVGARRKNDYNLPPENVRLAKTPNRPKAAERTESKRNQARKPNIYCFVYTYVCAILNDLSDFLLPECFE